MSEFDNNGAFGVNDDMGGDDASDRFDAWVDDLEIEVIQGQYGYEEGEFTVYPEQWRSMFDEGLTPSAAFKRALDAYGEVRREREAERLANYERIKREDAALIVTPHPQRQGLNS